MPVAMPLLNREGLVVAFAHVDLDDSDRVAAAGRWSVSSSGHVARTFTVEGRPSFVLLHRFILGLTSADNVQVDHINRNKLDNRRVNLRLVTPIENSRNRPSVAGSSSRHRGVTWHRKAGRWQASAMVDGRSFHLGLFVDEDDAADAARSFRLQHMTGATD